jgi:4-amino-4-deoxy-L-arabinose transferase-like glycosyltransferase
MSKLSRLSKRREFWVIVILILLAATFRIVVAHRWPNDSPDDGRTYAQIARNVLEQHVYSHETEAPYDPSFIRLPGYPLFLASIYSVFGHTNSGAVRIFQALIDTATCALVALLAFSWQPDEKRKRTTAIAALALAAVCPFTTIYAATILTEVPTTFLVMAMCLAATLAFRNGFTTERAEDDRKGSKRSLLWWLVAGLCGGLAVLFRPDSGLFAAAIGLTLVITGLFRVRPSDGLLSEKQNPPEGGTPNQLRRRSALPGHSKAISRVLIGGTLFSFAFVLVLVPWTIRNARMFHVFQPLAPSHGEMPGEFVPRGYNQWVRSWLDDESYVGPFLWSLDTESIDIDDVPASSFDSAEEKARVAELLDKYNHPPGADNGAQSQASPTPTPQASPMPTPVPGPAKSGAQSTIKPTPSPAPQKDAKANVNSNANAEDGGDEGDQNDNSSDQGDENDNSNADESDQSQPEDHGAVEMTPEIDAGFGQIARERIARHPFRYYVWLPLKRARTMWFDTHSQYWPFEGTLLPLEDLDYEHHQHIWLPLFAGLTAIYTLLGLAGAWLLWDSRNFAARRWLLLGSLAIVLRLILFSSMENPEPRYLVEFFPFLSVLGGIAIARAPRLFRSDR